MPGARHEFRLGGYREAVEERLERWDEERFGERLWAKDPTLWAAAGTAEIVDRLGWLDLPRRMGERLGGLVAFAAEVQDEGVEQVVLLGMGGSSLGPEVFQGVFGCHREHPFLRVLDTTHPEAVRAAVEGVDPERALFLVASKSGTTLETLSLFRAFWDRARRTVEEPGHRFAAVTDPGTPLAALARERGFRRLFEADPDVGGRFSAFTEFGMVPAALIGADVAGLLDRGAAMASACSERVPATANPGLALGAALGELASRGRDKVTFLTSPRLRPFPDWLEQLLAESTGKDGRGLVPVTHEPVGPPDTYGRDRVFVALGMEGDGGGEGASILGELARSGHPVLRIQLQDDRDLGGEIVRWEIAVAAAGEVLGIHPFDQPDVQLAKDLAREAMAAGAGGPGGAGAEKGVAAADPEMLARELTGWLGKAGPGDYLALQAYLPPRGETDAALRRIQGKLRDRTGCPATAGYGPRYLHSTGQLHKGGPPTGMFLQLVDETGIEVPVPEADYSFGELIGAQARGDLEALKRRGRRVLRVELGRDPLAGLGRLEGAVAGRRGTG